MSKQYDVLIKNAIIVDGSGNPWFRSDVAVENAKIVDIGRLGSNGKRVIDAEGMVVCPGFIDVHTHSDTSILMYPKAESFVMQGITTQINGNCGGSAAPMTKKNKEELERARDIKVDWETLGEYFNHLEKQGVAINTGSYVGHGTVRAAAMGYDDRAPTGNEMELMKGMVAQAMEEGAFGMSSGLVFKPGRFADTNEVIELCKVVARYNGLYNTHMRGQMDTFIEATKEAIYIAEEAGVSLQIAHHSPTMPPYWGRTKESLRLIMEARERGLDVTNDLHGYLGGGSSLQAGLPPWVQEGGDTRISERLRSPDNRDRIIKEIKGEVPTPEWKIKYSTGYWPRVGRWDEPRIHGAKTRPEWEGKSIKEIAESEKKDPWDAYFDILMEDPSLGIVHRIYSEQDRQRNLSSPVSMVSSDAFVVAPYGPLGKSKPSPKVYGTYPLIIRKYVRGETEGDLLYGEGTKLLTLEQAINKMTSLPAQKLHLWNRGLIRPGMWADIVIFDPETIADKATVDDPHQYPVGIHYVLVNGVVTVENGNHTGALAGKVLRHKA